MAVVLHGCWSNEDSSGGDSVQKVTSYTPLGSELPYEESGASYGSPAECLTDKGAVLYGAEWCRYTKQQKESFGDSFRHIRYVECVDQESLCDSKGINRTYPTWILDGKMIRGYTPPSELYDLAGCD